MQHIDDLDDIMEALRQPSNERISKQRFRQIVTDSLGSRAMSPANMDTLYHFLDR